MAKHRTIKISEEAYQKAHDLRVRLLEAGVTRKENGNTRPMTFGGVIEEGLELLEKTYPRRER